MVRRRIQSAKAPGTRGGLRVSPAQVEAYLERVNFPADRGDLIAAARQAEAPDEVLGTLEGIPDFQYNDLVEVNRALVESQ